MQPIYIGVTVYFTKYHGHASRGSGEPNYHQKNTDFKMFFRGRKTKIWRYNITLKKNSSSNLKVVSMPKKYGVP